MSTPYYQDDAVTLYHGDCLDALAELPDASVDAVVTDPPYALEFMGRSWDGWSSPRAFQEWCALWATECLRVLKPGGHMLAFGGSRTWHRLAAAVEDAGFEIRDSIAWLYGSGFPKSLDVSKAIEQRERGDLVRAKLVHFAAARSIDGKWLEAHGVASASSFADWTIGGHVPSDRNWQIIKAALEVTPDEEAEFEREVIAEGRSRVDDGTVYELGHSGRRLGGAVTEQAQRWQGWGTALKPAFEPVVVGRKPLAGTVAANVLAHGTGALSIDACRVGDEGAGRWPTNVVLDESQAAELDEQTGVLTSGKMRPTHTTAARAVYGQNAEGGFTTMETYGDSGGASRFFPTFRYEAKAPAAERPRAGETAHPTVKPLDLMRWLVRLVTPPGGTVLEPFAGSGTTAEACVIEGFHCIAIEREADYLPLITQRLTKPIAIALDFGALA